jgi:hypothetical protein
MTKRREPLTYQLTLTKVAALIGWDRCGAICGVSERSVRYWSDPECETEIRMIDAERLDRAFMEAGGDHAPFHHLMALRLELAAREGEQVISLARLAGQCAKEAGEAVAALVDASSNAGDPAARRAAKAEVEQAIDALTSGIGALDRLG